MTLFPTLIRTSLDQASALSQSVVLFVMPHGGQATARRNAYRAVLHDESAAAQRRRVSTVIDQLALPRLVAVPDALPLESQRG